MTGLSVESVLPWLGTIAAVVGTAILRIAVILVVGYIGIRFVKLGLRQLERVIVLANEAGEQVPGTAKKCAATLTGILRTIAGRSGCGWRPQRARPLPCLPQRLL